MLADQTHGLACQALTRGQLSTTPAHRRLGSLKTSLRKPPSPQACRSTTTVLTRCVCAQQLWIMHGANELKIASRRFVVLFDQVFEL